MLKKLLKLKFFINILPNSNVKLLIIVLNPKFPSLIL